MEQQIQQLQQQVQQLQQAQQQAQQQPQPVQQQAVAVQQPQIQTGIALPKVFDDGDLVSWLECFDVCATANNWADDNRLRRLPTLLSGRAFAVFQRLAGNQKDTLAHLRENLLGAFLPDEQRGARYAEFDSCCIKDGESIEVFAYRLESLLRQAVPDVDGNGRETILKQRFIRGLSATIRLRLYENPALTYAQCELVARRQSNRLSLQPRRRKTTAALSHPL